MNDFPFHRFTGRLLGGWVLGLMLANAASAQLMAPGEGAVGTYSFRVGAVVDPGATGAGATWDFSGLQPQGATILRTMAPAAEHPQAKAFGAAEWWVTENGLDLFMSWSSGYTYHGGIQGAMVVAYSDPEVYHPYPFALGQSHEDGFTCSYGAGGIAVERLGTLSAEAVGQGSLVLPGGAGWENVYRVNLSEDIVDQTALGNYQIIINGSYFYHADYLAPLLSVVEVTTIDDTGSGGEPIVTEQAYSIWVESFAVGVEEAGDGVQESGVRGVVMPNPTRAGGKVTVVWPAGGAPSTLEIWNPAGVRVHEQRVAPGVPSVSWDATGWPSGLYLVRGVETGEVLRWVIE